MKEMIFTAGQMVWSPLFGFGVLENALPTRYLCFKGHYFDSNGIRPHYDDTHRSLFTLEEAKLLGLEPPKKKVKKTIECWVNVYPKDMQYEARFRTKFDADQCKVSHRIACVKMSGEYEIEE